MRKFVLLTAAFIILILVVVYYPAYVELPPRMAPGLYRCASTPAIPRRNTTARWIRGIAITGRWSTGGICYKMTACTVTYQKHPAITATGMSARG